MFARVMGKFNRSETLYFKQQRPETVLLYGNHDLHYLIPQERASRYDHLHAWDIKRAFADHNLFAGTPYRQVFGHTQVEDIVVDDGLVCVDCLGTLAQSYKCYVD